MAFAGVQTKNHVFRQQMGIGVEEGA